MLKPGVRAYGSEVLVMVGDYSADYPDLQEKLRLSLTKIFDLSRGKYAQVFLNAIPVMEGIEANIQIFTLTLNLGTLSAEDKDQFLDLLRKYKITFQTTEDTVLIKPYFDLKPDVLGKLFADFKCFKQPIISKPSPIPAVKREVQTPESYQNIYETLSKKQSRQSKKTPKKSVNCQNNNNLQKPAKPTSLISMTEEDITKIQSSLGDNTPFYPIINDQTGTQILSVNWDKINQSEFSPQMTQPIKEKFGALFTQARIVGNKGSGLKYVKGKHQAQGFFLKAKIGEDLELYAKRKSIEGAEGRRFTVYEFDTVADHKSQKR